MLQRYALCFVVALLRTLTLRLQVHDRMTECIYATPLQSFATQIVPKPVITIPVTTRGRAALEAINKARDEASLPLRWDATDV